MKIVLILAFIATVHSFRLPETFVPENYRLKVITFLNEDNQGFKFQGKVWITVSSAE